ncbi:MAG TPA: methyltransferase domain-containing protein [Actinophytocola sp.]|jgi:protein arginine N-methyltransferase 1|uniref:methyltransferase domain-containing protein n=1 Tax=Actinophytocola sp. TaxID=1872138 RepID=UPI002E0277AF|nr:methyltransferase domain-containing protein [Actinophytocola sp.]
MDQALLLMHQMMLADRSRMRAYGGALERTVGPGSIVVDVGAGTLALSMLALERGAGHVYAIEADPEMAAVAERIIADNDVKDRVTLIQGDARVVRLPRKADVVVAEMMGNLGPEEDMMAVLGAVARRNLRPGGVVVPRGLTTTLAAIQFDGEGWGIWGRDFHGYRLDAVQEYAEPRAQLHFFQREPVLLSEPVPLAGTVRLDVARPGEVHAIMGYFTAELAEGITLSNFPSYPGCNWAVWIWPVRHTALAPGDEIRVTVHRPRESRAARVATDWRLDCGIVRR